MKGRPRGVFTRAVTRGPAARSGPLVAGALALAALLAGCGGGARQDAHESSASYQLEVTHASFPRRQAVARPTSLELTVHNSGSHTVPLVAVTLNSLTYQSQAPELADRTRPIWAVEEGPGPAAKPPVSTQEVSKPGDAVTAYLNTWALGALRPGASRSYVWKLMPVKAGSFTVHYAIAAGLSGKAKAVSSNGGAVAGVFTADVAGAPSKTHVNPKTGKVEAGAFKP